jgi:hypothetical protein
MFKYGRSAPSEAEKIDNQFPANGPVLAEWASSRLSTVNAITTAQVSVSKNVSNWNPEPPTIHQTKSPNVSKPQPQTAFLLIFSKLTFLNLSSFATRLKRVLRPPEADRDTRTRIARELAHKKKSKNASAKLPLTGHFETHEGLATSCTLTATTSTSPIKTATAHRCAYDANGPTRTEVTSAATATNHAITIVPAT